jgi:hypothetical protein
VFHVRPLGGAPSMHVRLGSAQERLPRWVSALVILIAAAAVAIGLILAGFGLFAALRIAHGYGSSVEHAATPVAPGAPRWRPNGGADRVIPGPIGPPVVASSDPAENEAGLQTGSMGNEPSAGDAEPVGTATRSEPNSTPQPTDSAPADVPPAASGVPTPGTAADGAATGSIDRAAVSKPTGASAAPRPQHAKPRHAVKHHAVRKVVRRVAQRSAYFGAAAGQFQPTFHSGRRAGNSSAGASPFQPMFSSP